MQFKQGRATIQTLTKKVLNKLIQYTRKHQALCPGLLATIVACAEGTAGFCRNWTHASDRKDRNETASSKHTNKGSLAGDRKHRPLGQLPSRTKSIQKSFMILE
eukprot:GABV01011732.1.p1 GENE.GABV01011732.1~~GABV01011732.1.p1  ORF type:complete len:104 (-),score=1.53 GABV01011732.1:72-383(-)